MNSTRMPSFIEMVRSAKKFYIFSEVMGIFLGVHWSRGSLSLKCQTQRGQFSMQSKLTLKDHY